MSEMIEHQGVVNSLSNGRMMVRVNLSGCHGCGQGSGCAISRLSRQDNSQTLIELDALPNLQVGDPVTLSLPSSQLGLYALLGYFFPALAFVTGAAIGSAWTGNDAGTAIVGLISFVLGLLTTRFVFPILPGMKAHIRSQHSTLIQVKPISHFS